VETSLPGKSYGDLQGSSSGGSAPRNISGVSTLDANVNSTGGETILFAKEVTTQAFCGVLFAHLCGEVWPKGIILNWVEGRDARLNWSKSYIPTLGFPLITRLTSLWKMGNERVEAQTDGGLFIKVADPMAETKVGKRLVWTRSYYVLPLEVTSHPPTFVIPSALSGFAHHRPTARSAVQEKTA
jgi:hypothetical protein